MPRPGPTPRAAATAGLATALLALSVGLLGPPRPASGEDPPPPAEPPADRQVVAAAADDLARLAQRVPSFAVVDLPAAGRVELDAADGLTIDDLRGVPLDDDPPVRPDAAAPLRRDQLDGLPPDVTPPYVAEGIAPFRMRWFRCEINYAGRHTFEMQLYAAAHGFNVVVPSGATPAQRRHLPAGTELAAASNAVDWHGLFERAGIPWGRFDGLAALAEREDLPGTLTRLPRLGPPREPGRALMLDLEHGGVLLPEKLRQQAWYPAGAAAAARAAFERRYYHGWALTYTAPVAAARRLGWGPISIYGWAPVPRVWWGLAGLEADPANDLSWRLWGEAVYDAVDALNPSVYVFYPAAENVAFTLALNDLTVAFVAKLDRPAKPIRTYYMSVLHGGGGGDRWWREQPLTDEDARAMAAMGLFTGIDGPVLWCWAGQNPHRVTVPRARPLAEGQVALADISVDRPLRLRPVGAAADREPTLIRRYDVLRVRAVERHRGRVLVNHVSLREQPRHDVDWDALPVYALTPVQLRRHGRPDAAPVAAFIEGLALARPVERLLRFGRPRIDVPAQRQFTDTLPIVRRVQLGPYHVVATYDPAVVYGGEPRDIELDGFNGREGLALVLPADGQVRLFVLRDAGGG